MGTTLRQNNKTLYWAWKAMKQRCLNPRCRAFRNYGARGIGVCKEWNSFEPFYEWAINNGFATGFELDRIDNDGDYSPHNCRWVSRRKNINNRRNTTILTVNGVSKARTEWEEDLNLPYGIIKAWAITHGKDYAEKRIAEVIQHGYKERDFTRNHVVVPVRCVETGIAFATINEAARKMGINNGNISKAVRFGTATCGYHFEKGEI